MGAAKLMSRGLESKGAGRDIIVSIRVWLRIVHMEPKYYTVCDGSHL